MEQQLATVESNATLVYQKMPDPMVAVKEMGRMFAASGMFGCTKQEQGEVLALACLIEGKSPFELMRNYFIINGSLSMKAVAVLANFQKAGGNVTWKSALNNVEEARADFSMGNNELHDAVYTIADAQREGLVTGPNKHNWTARPADMLRARLVTKAIRMIAPGIIMGVSDETDAPQPMPTPSAPLLPAADGRGAGSSTVSTVGEAGPGDEPISLEQLLMADGIVDQQAIEFLISTKLLEEGKQLSDLTPAARKRIMKNYPSFRDKVREHAKAQQPELTTVA
jgi:hypothetical protein